MDESQESKAPSEKKLNPLLIGSIVLAIAVLGAGLWVSNSNTSKEAVETQVSDNTNKTQPEVAGLTDVSEEENSDMRTVEVEAGSFYYNPDEIRVKTGENVRIELTAKDMMHDFNIDELEVDSPVIQAGETVIIEFTAEEAGEYEYYCSVGNHRAMGQVGRLVVED